MQINILNTINKSKMEGENLEKKKEYIENIQKSILHSCHKKCFAPMTFKLDKQKFANCVNKHLQVYPIVFETIGKKAQDYRSIYFFKFFYKQNPLLQSIYSEDVALYRYGPPNFIFATDPNKKKNF
jgi:hypothetical protein